MGARRPRVVFRNNAGDQKRTNLVQTLSLYRLLRTHNCKCANKYISHNDTCTDVEKYTKHGECVYTPSSVMCLIRCFIGGNGHRPRRLCACQQSWKRTENRHPQVAPLDAKLTRAQHPGGPVVLHAAGHWSPSSPSSRTVKPVLPQTSHLGVFAACIWVL
jgi:hypothetical protein